MKTLIRVLAVGFVLCATAAPGAPARKHRRFTAWGVPEIYSNLSLDGPTGDVGGIEVILVPAYNGWWATVVEASGIAYDPVLVPVTLKGDKIEFTLPATEHDSETTKVVGKIGRAGLTLQMGNERKEFLFRQSGSKGY